MTGKRFFFGGTVWLAATLGWAQTDGRSFDAVTVLTPGMSLQRNGILYDNDYQAGLLQHGDLIFTHGAGAGPYLILTSDGSVIGLGSGATMAIDGRRIGFDVFRVLRGSAAIVGNVRDGYVLPIEFSRRLPTRWNNVIVFPSPPPPDLFYYPVTPFPANITFASPFRTTNGFVTVGNALVLTGVQFF